MTAIVGLVERGRIYLGGDSAGVGGYSLSTRKDPKVFRVGDFLMGYTSSFRMGQLLEFGLSPPDHDPRESSLRYMVTRFIPAVQKCLRDGGFLTNDKGQESGGTFIVGWKGELFTIHSDFQVARESQNYFAVGCGQDLLLGAMAALSQGKLSPERRIQRALEIAESFSSGVRGPFHVISMATPKTVRRARVG